jgi:hypothetical protein
MKLLALLSVLGLVALGLAQPPAGGVQARIPGLHGNFKTGARPTPRFRLVAARRFIPGKAAPAQAAWVPSKLSFWLNDQDGDCVTAEEAFAKACSGIFISDATVKTWASKNGVLNGADLDQVMNVMETQGFLQDGNTYNDGPYSSVDYSTESVLQSAIALGPVKIGIDASALPSTAGNANGWVAVGGKPGQFTSEDHCVSICCFGTAQYIFSQLHVPLPSTLQPTQAGYGLFTWNTIGFVDHAWIMSTCGEAWVRNPTSVTVGTGTPTPDPPLNPPAPAPAPAPTPPPAPTPSPTPAGITTITLNNPIPAGSYEVSATGTAAAVANLNAAVQQLNALSIPPAPPPPATTIEQRVASLETGMNKIVDVLADIQKVLTGGKR